MERNAEAQRSGDADPPRARFIWCLYREAKWSGRAHAVGRVGVAAERRLGVERNGNKVTPLTLGSRA